MVRRVVLHVCTELGTTMFAEQLSILAGYSFTGVLSVVAISQTFKE